MEKCSKCHNELEEHFKFCPYCGFSMIQNCESAKIITPDDITIEFNFSTAQTFGLAIEEARRISTFQQIGNGKKALFRLSVDNNEIELLNPILRQLKGWKNRKVYIKGIPVLWETVFSYFLCNEKHKSDYKPDLYCFGYQNMFDYNIWGCIHTGLKFSSNATIFTLGKWINQDGDFEFDKNKIIEVLEQNLYPYRFCPSLNWELIKEIVKAFPEKVNPHQDYEWTFVRSWDGKKGLKVRENFQGYQSEYWAIGAEPTNLHTFYEELSQKVKDKLPKEFISTINLQGR